MTPQPPNTPGGEADEEQIARIICAYERSRCAVYKAGCGAGSCKLDLSTLKKTDHWATALAIKALLPESTPAAPVGREDVELLDMCDVLISDSFDAMMPKHRSAYAKFIARALKSRLQTERGEGHPRKQTSPHANASAGLEGVLGIVSSVGLPALYATECLNPKSTPPAPEEVTVNNIANTLFGHSSTDDLLWGNCLSIAAVLKSTYRMTRIGE